MHVVLHSVCWAEMSNMTDTLTVHDYILHCQASDWSVAETLHCSDVNSTPAFWESVSRPGVSNARADNPFESNLTGHWKWSERQLHSQSDSSEMTAWTGNISKNGKNTSQGGSHRSKLVCQGWYGQRLTKGLDSKKNKSVVTDSKLKWPDSSSPQP